MRNLIKACLVSGLISVGLTAGVRAETLFIDTATAAVERRQENLFDLKKLPLPD